ncbi:MAG: right-handed parallel beta-helix repeat-containing protein [Ignavibacteria bacterium]|nr:right-handed parallel beta-helix repeat-containing protein [Ignavibacteria bacterium]
MMNNISIKTVYLLILLITLPLHSEIRYVSKTGSAQPPYTSWATASDSIQKCINISSFGDTIYVGNGTYIEQVFMINGLSLIGSGWDSCIIDTRTISTSSGYRTITMKDGCIIDGFHIIVSNSKQGTAIHNPGNYSSPSWCEIKNNKISSAGWGITMDTYATIKNNTFDNLRTGIEIYSTTSAIFDSVYGNIFLNMDSRGILTSLSGRGIIFDNFIQMGAGLPTAIGISSGGLSKIFNNIMIGTNKKGYGFSAGSPSVPYEVINNVVINFDQGIRTVYPWIIKNNVSIKNTRGIYNVFSTQPIVSYNNSWGNIENFTGFIADSTNLSVDPMFVNEENNDFHLQMYSLLINAGDPEILDPDSSRSDIGVYGGPLGKSYQYLDYPPKYPTGLALSIDSTNIYLSWKKNTESDFSYYTIYSDTITDFTVSQNNFISQERENILVYRKPSGVNRIYFKLTSTDMQGNESKGSEEIGVELVSTGNETGTILQEYKLYQNYPNPYNPSTIIPYRIKEGGDVTIYIYDTKGELVEVIVNEYQTAGYHEREFRPKSSNGYLASGIYFYKIEVKGNNGIPVFRDIKKMIYLK